MAFLADLCNKFLPSSIHLKYRGQETYIAFVSSVIPTVPDT